jgi:hypothetical protein
MNTDKSLNGDHEYGAGAHLRVPRDIFILLCRNRSYNLRRSERAARISNHFFAASLTLAVCRSPLRLGFEESYKRITVHAL